MEKFTSYLFFSSLFCLHKFLMGGLQHNASVGGSGIFKQLGCRLKVYPRNNLVPLSSEIFDPADGNNSGGLFT